MKTFEIGGVEYSPNIWYVVDGDFIFMLNDIGINKFHITVHGGYDSDQIRIPHDKVAALTDLISQFLNNYNIGGKA